MHFSRHTAHKQNRELLTFGQRLQADEVLSVEDAESGQRSVHVLTVGAHGAVPRRAQHSLQQFSHRLLILLRLNGLQL